MSFDYNVAFDMAFQIGEGGVFLTFYADYKT
jgi:hypothetical protein